ncbi:MAG: hypothetical protein IPI49_10545 [Myxococcales bacterium]|nr:hypothetical protein [Myxococcales bacterium]
MRSSHGQPVRRLAATAAAAAVAIMVSACGDEPTVAVGDAVWNDEASRLVLFNEGGGLGGNPPGSECVTGSAEYTLSISSSALTSLTTWRCEGAPLRKVARQRSLDSAELSALQPTLRQLTVVDSAQCGADKPKLTLRVTTAGKTVEYRDSFYGCLADPRPQVDYMVLDALQARLAGLLAG